MHDHTKGAQERKKENRTGLQLPALDSLVIMLDAANRFCKGTDSLEFFPVDRLGVSDIDIGLKVEEIGLADAEIQSQADGCIRGDLPSIMEDILDTGYWYIDIFGETICRNAQGVHEFLLEDFADCGCVDSIHILSLHSNHAYYTCVTGIWIGNIEKALSKSPKAMYGCYRDEELELLLLPFAEDEEGSSC